MSGSMKALPPFQLERYFARYEFATEYLLSPSDCESLTLAELLALADADGRDRWQRLTLGYTESAGLPALREEVARLYRTVSADDVLILTPEEGIFLAMHALLEQGDHVIAMAPAYQSLHEVARAIGCQLTLWQVRPQGDRWQLDVDELARAVTGRTRLIVLNFPHNPTGYLPSRALLDRVLEIARKQEIFVFSDEMYRLLEQDPAQRLDTLCDLDPLGISLSGLSKSFALPGLRIGWLATRARALRERCLSLKDYTTICHSAPSEVLALIALRAGKSILARNRDIVQSNLPQARTFCREHDHALGWYEPDAGCIAFPRWRGDGTVEEFCRAALETRGVLIVPGSMFGALDQHFRIGLGRRNLPQALARLRDLALLAR
jgi:aspartate/methionine/tyrosine aminotransferase